MLDVHTTCAVDWASPFFGNMGHLIALVDEPTCLCFLSLACFDASHKQRQTPEQIRQDDEQQTKACIRFALLSRALTLKYLLPTNVPLSSTGTTTPTHPQGVIRQGDVQHLGLLK
jgi:hypothetical protein